MAETEASHRCEWFRGLAFAVAALTVAVVPNVVLSRCMEQAGASVPVSARLAPSERVILSSAVVDPPDTADGAVCHGLQYPWWAAQGPAIAWAARWTDDGRCTIVGRVVRPT